MRGSSSISLFIVLAAASAACSADHEGAYGDPTTDNAAPAAAFGGGINENAAAVASGGSAPTAVQTSGDQAAPSENAAADDDAPDARQDADSDAAPTDDSSPTPSANGDDGTTPGVDGTTPDADGTDVAAAAPQVDDTTPQVDAAAPNTDESSASTTAAVTTTSCFVDAGTAAGSAINLQLVPSRVSGVAPLSVFFDSVGTTASATTRPFHELGYCWDFGDTGAGSFSTTGRSKNQAKGPVSTHVFEKPGTYTVTLQARDSQGRVQSKQVSVHVDDPEQVYSGSNTICFSTSGTYDGCPSGAQHVKTSTVSTLNSYLGTKKRLLLRRGETFTSANVGLSLAGPGTIGAYGSGNRPKIDSNGVMFSVSSADKAMSDVRVMDLDIVGRDANAGIANIEGTGKDLLFLRVRAQNVGQGIIGSASLTDYQRQHGYPNQDLFDLLTLEDCEVRDLIGGQGHTLTFISARRFSMLGSIYKNAVNGEHVFRSSFMDRGVMSNNDMGGAPPTKHVIKLHAPSYTTSGSIGTGKYSERIVISENIFHGDGGHVWTVAVSPQNAQQDERLRDVIVERNLFNSDGNQDLVSLEMSGENMTVRDNVFNRGSNGICMEISQRGIEPVPTGITIANNTCANDGSTALTMAGVYMSGTKANVFNNLVASAKQGSVFTGSGQVTQGGNLLTSSPGFTSSKPANAADFQLSTSSAAVDKGDKRSTSFWDYAGKPRPKDGNGSGSAEFDVGAYELTR